jgi:hypothetical protein
MPTVQGRVVLAPVKDVTWSVTARVARVPSIEAFPTSTPVRPPHIATSIDEKPVDCTRAERYSSAVSKSKAWTAAAQFLRVASGDPETLLEELDPAGQRTMALATSVRITSMAAMTASGLVSGRRSNQADTAWNRGALGSAGPGGAGWDAGAPVAGMPPVGTNGPCGGKGAGGRPAAGCGGAGIG